MAGSAKKFAHPCYHTFRFVPESPRWLIQKQRFREAEQAIARIARNNQRPMPNVAIIGVVAQSVDIDQRQKRQYSFLDLYRSAEMRKRTLALAVLW